MFHFSVTKRYTAAFCKYYTRDLFQNLINTERKPMGTPKLTSITRTCIVNWIMKINVSNDSRNPDLIICARTWLAIVVIINYNAVCGFGNITYLILSI